MRSFKLQILHDYNPARSLHCHSRFDDLDLGSRSQVCQKLKVHADYVFIDSCPLQFKRCIVAIYIEEIMQNMTCVSLLVCVCVCIEGRSVTCFRWVKCLGLSNALTLGFSQTP